MDVDRVRLDLDSSSRRTSSRARRRGGRGAAERRARRERSSPSRVRGRATDRRSGDRARRPRSPGAAVARRSARCLDAAERDRAGRRRRASSGPSRRNSSVPCPVIGLSPARHRSDRFSHRGRSPATKGGFDGHSSVDDVRDRPGAATRSGCCARWPRTRRSAEQTAERSTSAVESRSGRIRLLDRLLRREIGAVRTPVRPAV